MKNSFFLVLIILLVLPTFTPWIPHGAMHALHDHQENHHQNLKQIDNSDDSYDHAIHDHDTQTSDHHPIILDAVTYFNDYLHIDLQSPYQATLKVPELDMQDANFGLIPETNLYPRYELASVQNRAPPPDWQRHNFDKTPPYISTQRLRI